MERLNRYAVTELFSGYKYQEIHQNAVSLENALKVRLLMIIKIAQLYGKDMLKSGLEEALYGNERDVQRI